MHSDNKTNFVGVHILNPPENLANYFYTEEIEWKFIPPIVPNFGGLWKATIKGFKYHFMRVMGNAKLTYEDFLTVGIEFRIVLNSRPLRPLSNCEKDFGVLITAHFLVN